MCCGCLHTGCFSNRKLRWKTVTANSCLMIAMANMLATIRARPISERFAYVSWKTAVENAIAAMMTEDLPAGMMTGHSYALDLSSLRVAVR